MKDWKPFVSNAPLALIALPAAYGSAAFESRVYQEPWNIGIGVGVEAAYTGIIFFASRKSRKAFLSTALTAMFVGVVYNSLHAADVYSLLNHFNDWGLWALSLIHGAPLSVLAFSYGLLMHFSSDARVEPVIQVEEVRKPELVTEPIAGSGAQPDLTNLVIDWQRETEVKAVSMHSMQTSQQNVQTAAKELPESQSIKIEAIEEILKLGRQIQQRKIKADEFDNLVLRALGVGEQA